MYELLPTILKGILTNLKKIQTQWELFVIGRKGGRASAEFPISGINVS